MTTDLVADLVKLAEAERDVAYSVDMKPEDTANWQYALTALRARDELERLERERDEWSGTAAQRLRETQMALHERDCAVERIADLQRAPVDGHCRKCTCDDCTRFYYELDRFPRRADDPRRPPPPDALVDAVHERVHHDTGLVRAAVAARHDDVPSTTTEETK